MRVDRSSYVAAFTNLLVKPLAFIGKMLGQKSERVQFPIYRQYVQVGAMSKHYGVFGDLFLVKRLAIQTLDSGDQGSLLDLTTTASHPMH